jgi:hypothetical protein
MSAAGAEIDLNEDEKCPEYDKQNPTKSPFEFFLLLFMQQNGQSLALSLCINEFPRAPRQGKIGNNAVEQQKGTKNQQRQNKLYHPGIHRNQLQKKEKPSNQKNDHINTGRKNDRGLWIRYELSAVDASASVVFYIFLILIPVNKQVDGAGRNGLLPAGRMFVILHGFSPFSLLMS